MSVADISPKIAAGRRFDWRLVALVVVAAVGCAAAIWLSYVQPRGSGEPESKPFMMPAEEVMEATYQIPFATGDDAAQPFLASSTDDAATIARLVGMLRGAPAYGVGSPEVFHLPVLHLVFADGTQISALPALDCVTGPVANGTGTTCTPADGRVDVIDGDRTWRVNSPALAEWIDHGWKADVRVGPASSGP